MFKSLETGLTRFVLAFYDRGAGALMALNRLIGGSRIGAHLPKPSARLLLELFVALSLSVYFFYLVRAQGVMKSNGNFYPAFTFSYLTDHQAHSAGSVPANWRTRLAAPALSSFLLEARLGDFQKFMGKYPTFNELCRSEGFQNVFGFYHAAWLFLLFASLILFRTDALLIMLGVFAGLMYNLVAGAGMYYYPWDLPALFFFTLACLLFNRGWIGLLLPVVVIGTLFKETVLCCSLLILLGAHWDWKRRGAAFLGTVLAAFALNRVLMACYGVKAASFAFNGASTASGLVLDNYFAKNLHLLFSWNLNHVLFANAGALLIMLLLPWRSRRDVLFQLVALVFAAGQFVYGIIDEVRVWYEILPLGWLLISEYLAGPGTIAKPDEAVARRLQASHWIALASVAVILTACALVVPKPSIAHAEIQPGLLAAAERGEAAAQFQVGVFYTMKNPAYEIAASWFQKSAAQGYSPAQDNLGLMSWDGVGVPLDKTAALHFFRASAEQGFPNAISKLSEICLLPGADLVEAYQWLKLATLMGSPSVADQLQKCANQLTPEQLAAADARAQKMYDRIRAQSKP